jgi:cytidine deaminase
VIRAPFSGGPPIARRLSELQGRVGPAVTADVESIVSAVPADRLSGSVVPAAAAADLVKRHGLESVRELALLALPVAGAMARPPISGYRVAAVGIEAGSGDLVLGGNVELPGTDLGTTVHAEGFVALRARRRGRMLETLAVAQARPCAHCRQTLIESAGADGLVLIDLFGHEVGIEDLYPWPFRPEALGVLPDDPAVDRRKDLSVAREGLPSEVGHALEEAGRGAHAPYSGAPSAVALRLRDGTLASAGCVESVAFNPSIDAVLAAIAEVIALRADPADIVEAWLGRFPRASVDPGPRFLSVVAAVAPGARATVVEWDVAESAHAASAALGASRAGSSAGA